MRFILIFAIGIFLSHSAIFGQGEIPVDLHSGAPKIQIPLYTVVDHDLAQPIGIVYSADGTQLVEQKGIVGIGWNLSVGSSIIREVRGLPDDYIGTGGDTRKGWFYNTIASDIANFPSTVDLSAATCSDELTADTTLTAYNYLVDTEPDIFHYNAGGVSGSFVFDNDMNIRLIPYRDVKIEYVSQDPPSNKKIALFKITTNDGVVYNFNWAVSSTRLTHKLSGITAVEFLRKDFAQYDYSLFDKGVTFNTEWKLSKKESPSGAYIQYNYSTQEYESKDTVRVGIRKLTSSELVDKAIYVIEDEVSMLRISTITTSVGGTVNFTMTNGILSKVSVIDGSLSKEFTFEYSSAGILSEGNLRTYLKSLFEQADCDKLPAISFTYIGVDFSKIPVRSNLPSIYSKSKDFWGYYNGQQNFSIYPTLYIYPSEPASERIRLHPIPNYAGQEYILNGANWVPDNINAQIGSLETISRAGGVTTFNYEPNDYYDEYTEQTLLGPGLRIKSITYFDGINPENNIVKNYEYTENGASSGRLVSKPVFAMPSYEYRDPEGSTVKSYDTLSAGSAQEMWEHLIVRVNKNINQGFDGGTVGYKKVKVSRPGSGSAEFEFTMPAVYGATSSGDWEATENKFVRPNTCPSMGIVSGGSAWAYPYSPNPNFSYERGLMLKKTERDSAGNLVRETTWTQQNIHKSGTLPEKVWGVYYDHYPNSSALTYFFGKYFLLTDVETTVSMEEVTTFDADDENKSVTTSTEYYYESSAHKLLTRTKSTGIDGTILTQRFKYPLDFGTIESNSDIYLEKIGDLQEAFRNGTPIEQSTSMQRISESEKVIAASLIKFSDFGVSGQILPFQQLSLNVATGINDFAYSTQALQSGTYKLITDPRYEVDNTFLAFDDYQIPYTSIGRNRIPVSTHWGYKTRLPVARVVNAKYNEFVFSSFETNTPLTSTGHEFEITSQIFGAGRTGNNALHPSVKLSKTVQKANVSNYKLTFWLKKESSAIDFNVKIKDVSSATVYYNNTFSVNPSGSGFELVEKIIPMSGVPSSFIIELQGQNFGGSYSSSPGLLPVIDDVSFYPENADLVTYTYEFPFGPSSVTDSRGTTAYTVYDNLGRVKYVLDKDKNIIQKTVHKFAAIPDHFYNLSISYDDPVYDLQSTTFTGAGECIDGVSYEWDFGTGYTAGNRIISHTFTALGTNKVKHKMIHPLYGVQEDSVNVNVLPKSVTSTLCAKGASTYSICIPGTVSSYSCSAITDTPMDTEVIFRVTDSGFAQVSETVTNYQWQKRLHSSGTWTNVGSNSIQFKQTKLFEETESFDVRCILTSNTGRTGNSIPIQVIIQTCE